MSNKPHASNEFAVLLANATDKLIEHLEKYGGGTVHGYIVLGIEGGDVRKMSTCSNIEPELMYQLLSMIVHNTGFRDVTEDTKRH